MLDFKFKHGINLWFVSFAGKFSRWVYWDLTDNIQDKTQGYDIINICMED